MRARGFRVSGEDRLRQKCVKPLLVFRVGSRVQGCGGLLAAGLSYFRTGV